VETFFFNLISFDVKAAIQDFAALPAGPPPDEKKKQDDKPPTPKFP